MAETLAECERWLNRDKSNKKMVQSLVGKLMFVTNCIKPARRFLACILATFRSLNDGAWTTLSHDFKLDLLWFVRFARAANGVFYYTPHRKVLEIQCDSSLVGGGGTALNWYYAWKYTPAHLRNYPLIHHLEAINLVVALKTLAPHIAEPGATILISTDNEASSWALQSGRTKDSVFASCSREIWLQALIHNYHVTIQHKRGSLIPMADALSRQFHDPDMAKFVSDAVRKNDLICVSPCLDEYVFFSVNI